MSTDNNNGHEHAATVIPSGPGGMTSGDGLMHMAQHNSQHYNQSSGVNDQIDQQHLISQPWMTSSRINNGVASSDIMTSYGGNNGVASSDMMTSYGGIHGVTSTIMIKSKEGKMG